MKRLLSLLLVALVAVGCSSSRTDSPTLVGTLQLEPSMLSAQKTIPENAMTQDELSTLVLLLQRADLVGALSGAGPFTVFAPINDGFGGVDASAMSMTDLQNTLKYHVVPGEYTVAELSDGMTLETLSGERITITTLQGRDADLKVDDADIVYSDIEASNGVIHLVNLALTPDPGGQRR
jgi:uncharacterized surface protein with fasciclin (FAS1) repeats